MASTPEGETSSQPTPKIQAVCASESELLEGPKLESVNIGHFNSYYLIVELGYILLIITSNIIYKQEIQYFQKKLSQGKVS